MDQWEFVLRGGRGNITQNTKFSITVVSGSWKYYFIKNPKASAFMPPVVW